MLHPLQAVVLKLNGGLGTGMGLDKAKSLLEVKDSLTFLDFTALQVTHLRKTNPDVKFMLMNSFSTSEDSMNFMAEKYPSVEYLSHKAQVNFKNKLIVKINK
jgi:UDP-N-acetylglucosamine pyrophosphorylase